NSPVQRPRSSSLWMRLHRDICWLSLRIGPLLGGKLARRPRVADRVNVISFAGVGTSATVVGSHKTGIELDGLTVVGYRAVEITLAPTSFSTIVVRRCISRRLIDDLGAGSDPAVMICLLGALPPVIRFRRHHRRKHGQKRHHC